MSFSKNFFSLVMSSHGGPIMVNGYILPKKTLQRGWSGGAKVLGKLSVPGRPTFGL